MSWAKIDDQLHAHHKVVALGDLMLPALGLNTLALSWSANQLTDGFVPEFQIRRLAPDVPQEIVDALVRVGLWDRAPDGYQIHDYLDWNPSREHVLEKREGARLRMNKLRGHDDSSLDVRANASRTSDERTRVVHPLPVPVPVPLEREKKTQQKKTSRPPATESDWDTFWAAYPKKAAPAAARKALEKALRIATLEEIMTGLRKIMPEWRTKDPQFIPYPATWLNQERWKDEPTIGFRPEPTRSTVLPLEPPMSPEEEARAKQAAKEALEMVKKLGSGIGRPMP